MAESAVLFHSYSFAAPRSRDEPHEEDNTIHALSQSVSFGRFTTENLEWGKWSSFSHKKYVDEAEKYSQPGSVAQKKAFFDAHYKKIAEAKKAKQVQQPESVAVLLNTLETLTNKDEVKEVESGETELVSNIEKDEEEPKRTSEQEDVVEAKTVIEEDDLQAVIEVLDGLEEKEKSSSVKEERKSVTKNSSLFRSEAPEKAMEVVVTRKTSENLMKNKEKPVHQRFNLLKLLMGNTKTQRQNSKRKTDKKPNKLFLCLCFNPDVVRETKGPTETQRRNL
ncbi:Transcriptional regulator ATRX-like protein [Hirschfeldia incana]|nr:Transcriptional regulator ATRX-like protein [Hirschfeldia incana]